MAVGTSTRDGTRCAGFTGGVRLRLLRRLISDAPRDAPPNRLVNPCRTRLRLRHRGEPRLTSRTPMAIGCPVRPL